MTNVYPHIIIPPPGPKARAIIEKDQLYNSPSYTRAYPLVVDHAEDVFVWDVDGNRYLDFTSGVAVLNTGHCHPDVVHAVQKQATQFLHMAGTDFYYPLLADLAEKLAHLPGEGRWKVFFTNSGTESIEAALKLARYSTRKTDFIAFYGAFHGRTLGSLSLTASKAVHHAGFHPTVGRVFHAPYPNVHTCPIHTNGEDCVTETVHFIEHHILNQATSPDNVAALFVEPIQGEGGYIFPPSSFLPALRELTRKYDILLVVDEIQTGMGRTGKMFAYQHTGIQPDIICVAKGIASGLPLGAMIARDDIMTWPVGAHANTFGGNPVACASALATLDLLENGLMKNAEERGRDLLEKLGRLKEKFTVLTRVEGLGLMVGVELSRNGNPFEPAHELRDALVHACFKKGLLLLGCGKSTIRFIPPLTVARDHIDACVDIFERCLGDLMREVNVQ